MAFRMCIALCATVHSTTVHTLNHLKIGRNVDKDLNEYKETSLQELDQRLDAKLDKWLKHTKERILTLPDSEEKTNLIKWVNSIENS
jgi:hypothetical protein